MKLIFLRHGQTDNNKRGILQGQEIDAPLNSDGIRQVEGARDVLSARGIVFDALLASPMKRTLQTAEIINQRLGVDIIVDERLKEVSYGRLAGKTWAEIAEETGDAAAREKEMELVFDYGPFGGESVSEVKRRVGAFIEEMGRERESESLLVASHGTIIDVVHLLLLPAKEKMEIRNAGLYEFNL